MEKWNILHIIMKIQIYGSIMETVYNFFQKLGVALTYHPRLLFSGICNQNEMLKSQPCINIYDSIGHKNQGKEPMFQVINK